MSINKSEIKEIICSEHIEVIQQFRNQFNEELEIFVEEVCNVYDQFHEKSSSIGGDKRTALVSMYIFNGIKNLIQSFQLLFMGYIVSSGNLMRQFMESIDMAILLSISNTEYEKFERKGEDFSVGYASSVISKCLESTKISPEAWTEWIEMEKDYNLTSHPSAFALSENMDFESGNLVIGPWFDMVKKEGYLKEINIRISAARNLLNILDGLYGRN